jgi:hypothetical protein
MDARRGRPIRGGIGKKGSEIVVKIAARNQLTA